MKRLVTGAHFLLDVGKYVNFRKTLEEKVKDTN